MEYECVEAKSVQGWLVEAINLPGEGEIFSALFTGPDDEKRAREYADWKNG